MMQISIKARLAIIIFGFLGWATVANATLTPLGNGLVNDDVLSITWMQDPNLFKTLCDANDPIATGFTPVDAADANTICANNGGMTWNDAELWIAALNTANYLGHNDWRQPVTAQPDAACSDQVPASGGFSAQGYGYNCANLGSELNHLFYTSLSNPNALDDNCYNPPTTNPNHCFQNTVPFSNAQALFYWSGSSFAPNTTDAWSFDMGSGYHSVDYKLANRFVWPVRSGLSVVAPVAPVTPQNVPTLSIWGLGIMSLLLAFVARRKARSGF